MLTSKQRAKLRSTAQSCDTIFFIGKSGLSDEIINQLENAINARELIKLGVQENCEYSAREAADIIAPQLNAEVVAVIGRKFVLWRESRKPKKPAIRQPKRVEVRAEKRIDKRAEKRTDKPRQKSANKRAYSAKKRVNGRGK